MWMPIEFAPKDGTVVLLYSPTRPVWSVVSGLWRSDWRVPDWDTVCKHSLCKNNTHWMPLPPSPEQPKTQDFIIVMGD